MRHLATLLCLSALVSACGSKSGEPGAPTNPSTVPSSPTPASSPTLISVGEEVTGVIEDPSDSYVYELIAPSNGMLTARLTWEPAQAGSPLLSVADSVFFAADSSPVVGSLPVSAGQKYRVTVTDPATPWDYGGVYVRFKLNTSIEGPRGTAPTPRLRIPRPAVPARIMNSVVVVRRNMRQPTDSQLGL